MRQLDVLCRHGDPRRREFHVASVLVARTSAKAAGPSAGGVYELASGKCIDVSGAGTANMVLLVQVACGAGRPISSPPLWRRAAGSVW